MGPQDLRLEEMPVPQGVQGEAVVDVAFCGVCGTDLHEVAHGPTMIRMSPHPLTGQAPPVTLGHEISGVIRELQPEDAERAAALELAPGTRVVIDPTVRCGVCRWCRVGQYHQCPRSGSFGLARDGGFAPSLTAPLQNLYPVPDNVPDDLAALAEPLAVGLHAVTRADLRAGDTILVQGAGPIGLAVILAAQVAGASSVFVAEVVPSRAHLAGEIGATAVFDPTNVDVRREVFRATGRIGPDVVIDATGLPQVIATAVDTVRRGGTVVMAGIGEPELQLDARKLLFYERTVRGSLGSAYEIPKVLQLMSTGRMDPRPLISNVAPLADGVEVLTALMADRHSGAKTLIHP